MPGHALFGSVTAPCLAKLTLGHSPDPDDAFMFYALAEHKIDTGGWQFEHILQDIQTLNERATRGELHISAISIHAYAYVLDKYALLPCGASMGDGYGPMLVAATATGVARSHRRLGAVRDWLRAQTHRGPRQDDERLSSRCGSIRWAIAAMRRRRRAVR